MIDHVPRAQRFFRFGLGAALTFLSSCSILPAPETFEIYQLPPSSIANTTQADKLPWTLHVSTPHSSQITNSQRVLILRQDNRISAYKGVRWSDSPHVLLRDRLSSAFRADGRLNTVSYADNNLVTDLELSVDLSAFQVEYAEGMPVAVIRFYAALVQLALNRLIAARGFETRQPVEGTGMPEVITAFGRGADKIAAEVVDWTVEHGSALQSDVK